MAEMPTTATSAISQRVTCRIFFIVVSFQREEEENQQWEIGINAAPSFFQGKAHSDAYCNGHLGQ
jgi:hypothetical protein